MKSVVVTIVQAASPALREYREVGGGAMALYQNSKRACLWCTKHLIMRFSSFILYKSNYKQILLKVWSGTNTHLMNTQNFKTIFLEKNTTQNTKTRFNQIKPLMNPSASNFFFSFPIFSLFSFVIIFYFLKILYFFCVLFFFSF